QLMLKTAQEAVDRLQTEYHLGRSAQVRIWVYNSQKDLLGTQYSNSQDLVAGATYPEFLESFVAVPEGDKNEMNRVIPHEVSHLIVHQAVQNPFNTIPLWFDEGLAISAQNYNPEDMKTMVKSAQEDGTLMPLSSLNGEFPFAADGWYLA